MVTFAPMRRALLVTVPLALLMAAPTASAASVIEEIVVTATKRETTLQDTAVTVSVISAETVANSGATEINELFQGVPGLALLESPAELPVPRIRGIGSSSANQTFEQSVGLFLDGIYKPRAQQYTDSLFDVERIEVIRGAQGVVFGKNTNVGAISITTRKPGEQLGGEAYARYETEFESYIAGGAIDLPVSDSLKIRLGAQTSETGGFVDNIAPDVNEIDGDNERLVVRGTAVLDTGSNWDATLMVQYSDVETTGNAFQNVELFPGFDTGFLTAEPYVKDVNGDDIIGGTLLPREANTLDSTDVAFTLNVELSDRWSLTSLTSYSEFTYFSAFDSYTTTPANLAGALTALTGIPTLPPSLTQIFDEDFEQITQEIRFDYRGDNFNFIGGIFYQNQELSYSSRNPVANLVFPFGAIPTVPPTPVLGNVQGAATNTLDQDTDHISVFAQFGFDLSERLHLDIGARYSDEEKTGDFTVSDLDTLGLIPGFPSPNPADLFTTSVFALLTPTGTASEDEDDTVLDGSITLSYDLGETWLATFSVAQGTKSAGFNNSAGSGQVAPDPFTVRQEVAQTIEAGVKGTFADGLGYVSVTAFYSEIEDHQVSVFDPTAGQLGTGAFVTRNIDATSKGLEVEGLFAVTDDLTLNANFALLDAENDATGGRLNAAPEFTAALGADYNRSLSEAMNLQLGFQGFYSDGYLFRETPVIPGGGPLPLELQEIGSGSYINVDAYVGLTLVSSGIHLRFNVRNLTDEEYVTFAFPAPVFNNGVNGSYNRPRTYELSARFSF